MTLYNVGDTVRLYNGTVGVVDVVTSGGALLIRGQYVQPDDVFNVCRKLKPGDVVTFKPVYELRQCPLWGQYGDDELDTVFGIRTADIPEKATVDVCHCYPGSDDVFTIKDSEYSFLSSMIERID